MVDPSRVPRGRQQAITNSRLQWPIGESIGEWIDLGVGFRARGVLEKVR